MADCRELAVKEGKMIKCDKVTKIYKTGDTDTTVLKDINLKIESGEFVAIIGPSGSGKSTLMHILGALDTPSSGRYFLENRDVSKLSDNEQAELRKQKIGFVFQAFNLLPRTTVLKNVEMPLLYSQINSEKRTEMAKAALKLVGMEEARFCNKSNQLSGGQMQRVAIARALINDPAIIFADEPTGNLDSKTSHVVMETFQKLNKEGKTIILITHEHDIANYAKRIIQIRDGEIESDRRKK